MQHLPLRQTTIAALALLLSSAVPAQTAVPLRSTVFDTSEVPERVLVPDGQSVELGMRLCPKVQGVVRGIRFYRNASNTGPHTGTLWQVQANGALVNLGTLSFPSTTATGWVQANFAPATETTASQQPRVLPGSTYVVSYFTASGLYSATTNYFANRGVETPLFSVPADTLAAPNGVYQYGSGGAAPTSTYQSTNYWVDLDLARETPFNIFNPCANEQPETAAAADASSVELGVVFIPKVNGRVSTVRFLHNVGFGRAPGEATQVLSYPVSLWAADGTRLATGIASVSQNPTTGWMTGILNRSVDVVAGQTYIASYRAPAGRYPITQARLTVAYEGDLFTVPANGGVFTYGAPGDFPNQSWRGSNYFVDIGFVPAP